MRRLALPFLFSLLLLSISRAALARTLELQDLPAPDAVCDPEVNGDCGGDGGGSAPCPACTCQSATPLGLPTTICDACQSPPLGPTRYEGTYVWRKKCPPKVNGTPCGEITCWEGRACGNCVAF